MWQIYRTFQEEKCLLFPLLDYISEMYELQSAAVKSGPSDIKYDFSATQENTTKKEFVVPANAS